MKLTPNFSLEELTFSETAKRNGLENKPSNAVKKNLKKLCVDILQPLREKLGVPITVLSGYRSDKVNKLVGGSKNSQHMAGLAADIRVSNMKIKDLIEVIRELNLPYDQLINEFGSWVHVSTTDGSREPRKQVFSKK